MVARSISCRKTTATAFPLAWHAETEKSRSWILVDSLFDSWFLVLRVQLWSKRGPWCGPRRQILVFTFVEWIGVWKDPSCAKFHRLGFVLVALHGELQSNVFKWQNQTKLFRHLFEKISGSATAWKIIEQRRCGHWGLDFHGREQTQTALEPHQSYRPSVETTGSASDGMVACLERSRASQNCVAFFSHGGDWAVFGRYTSNAVQFNISHSFPWMRRLFQGIAIAVWPQCHR